MRVNAGGDPGRDDYGLPPVDIEVPDDARELARDVLAYRREQRSQRRHQLARWCYGPLTRDGMVLPLLAGCLALTLVAATLLTVFTARQPTVSLRPPRPGAGFSQFRPSAAALVNATLFAAGQPTPLSSLPGPVVLLALIPPGCRCLADLRELTIQATEAKTLIYLVGVHNAPVRAITADLGLGATQGLEDSADSLPPSYRVAALTAVLVRPDGTADPVVLQDHGHGFQIGNDVRALLPAAPASPRPRSTAPAASASPRPGSTAPASPAASGAPAGNPVPAATGSPAG
jgi:hypothetical protein